MGSLTPGWKLWLISLLVSVGCGVLAVGASVKVADRNTQEQLRVADQAKRDAAAVQLKITCNTISALIDAYLETPPVTASGKNVRDAYIEQYRILGCLPGK